MQTLRIGKTDFNLSQVEGMSKEEFTKVYNPLGVECEEAYAAIQKAIGREEKKNNVRKADK